MNSKRILCINPWIYDFTAYDLWSKPLGLLYIAAFLRERGLAVDWLDCLDRSHPALLKYQKRARAHVRRYGIGPFYREIIDKPGVLDFVPRHFCRYGWPEEIFRDELRAIPRPDAILVTTLMTYWYQGPQRVVEICREVFPKIPIILGGVYASLMPHHAQQAIRPDYLVTGPGEIQVAEILANTLALPTLMDNLPAVLDEYPWPAFDFYSHLDYLIVTTSRGCPYRCSFCATHQLNPQFYQRQPEAVINEILTQTRCVNVRDVAFYDDALLLNREKHIGPILEGLIKRTQKLRFHTPNGLHPRFIDREMAELMIKANFKTIRLSLESVAAERQADIHGKITPGEMTQAVDHLTKAGYRPRDLETYIIMGLPGQPLAEVLESVLYANSLGIQVRLASFSPIPGTADYEKAVRQGLYPPDMDPLLTNKTIMPLYRTTDAYYLYRHVRDYTQMLNEGVRRGVTVVGQGEFRKALRRAMTWGNGTEI